ncbi:hypothetical protein H4S06_006064, partial [Coemansia sp. BCRC 34490]
MVVLCYHIPTETWSEVYNSADTAAAYNAATAEAIMYKHRPNGKRLSTFPSPRFAQDWVFDRKTRRHYMFGGNPNRPNDKSARFNDTWEIRVYRPDSQDILRRALCLVRRRKFLDMCVGSRTLDSTGDDLYGSTTNDCGVSIRESCDIQSASSKNIIVGCAGDKCIQHLNPENTQAEDYKASAIPSPNSPRISKYSENPPSPTAKRSPSFVVDDTA